MKLCVEKLTNFMIKDLKYKMNSNFFSSRTKLETLADQKRSADRTLGNTVFMTIIANLAGRTSRPNCQACSGCHAGNWRGHSRESIHSDKRRDCER